MGLFDKLKNLSAIVDKIEKATGVDIDGSDKRNVQPQQRTAAVAPQQRTFVKPERGTAYFAAILRSNFPQYMVHQNVPASRLGLDAVGNEKPYDFVLYGNDDIAGVIMLTEHNRDRNMAFRNAKGAAQDAGIPFINFYKHYPNESDYVIERIRSYLK
ncbi:MAG: hypothetical protein PHT58_06550 [Eubacteriales bacterium]|nr:hypothetical protein [Eubacteriales bacterium]